MSAMPPMVQQLPWWLALALGIVALGAAIVLAAALFKATVALVRLAIQAGCAIANQLTTWIIGACVLAARACAGSIVLLCWLATRPSAYAWGLLRDAAITLGLNLRARIAQERELRRVWREEYRHLYPTWRAFLRAFESSEGPNPEDGNPFAPYRDAYEQACLVLGLPIDAAFTQGQLNTRYRILMAKAHPDAGGTHLQASELNRARETIRQQRGWQS